LRSSVTVRLHIGHRPPTNQIPLDSVSICIQMAQSAMHVIALVTAAGLISAVGDKAASCGCNFCGDAPAKNMTFGPITPGAVRPEPINPGARIKVLLSSFRDPRCAQTLDNLFKRAKNPSRLYVGVVDQQYPKRDKLDCLALYCAMHAPGPCPHAEQIESLRVDASQPGAQGPIWARAIGSQLVHDDDEFCMQTDAHMDFRNDFDELLLKTFAMTGNEYAVLSTYVGNIRTDINQQGENIVGLPHHEIPILCNTVRGAFGAVRNDQAGGTSCLEGPVLSALWGAGLSFAKCHFERVVPNDPGLAGLFDGEEFTRALRAFTNGYDIYVPHRPIVYHNYGEGTGVGAGQGWRGNGDKSGQRLLKLQNGEISMDTDPFGLGKLRTVEQFQQFSGIDPRVPGGNSDEVKKRCGHLAYVPHEDDPSRKTRKMPPLPKGFAKYTLLKGTDTMPEVDKKYIEIAQTKMLPQSQDAPRMPTSLQMAQFGNPPAEFWARLPAPKKQLVFLEQGAVGITDPQEVKEEQFPDSGVAARFNELPNLRAQPKQSPLLFSRGFLLAGAICAVLVGSFLRRQMCSKPGHHMLKRG